MNTKAVGCLDEIKAIIVFTCKINSEEIIQCKQSSRIRYFCGYSKCNTTNKFTMKLLKQIFLEQQ